MLHLEKVDADNLWKLVKLAVRPDQADFVATNTESILEAYVTITAGGVALPMGIYQEDTPVGFAMFGYGTTGDADEPEVARDSYCLWRFMLDAKYQGQGLGREALAACMAFLREKPCGPASCVWLSYEPENTHARVLYEHFGFRENGDKCGEEIVAVCPL